MKLVEVTYPTPGAVVTLEYKFTMPESDVNITADFAFRIQLMAQGSGGTVSAFVNGVETVYAKAGDEVVVKPEPAEGYTLAELQARWANYETYQEEVLTVAEQGDGDDIVNPLFTYKQVTATEPANVVSQDGKVWDDDEQWSDDGVAPSDTE
ncbi:MAG: hypothetical protein IJ176_09000 [Prevotella sp.]|nr:hypothetical protein [Prevotella sp.]